MCNFTAMDCYLFGQATHYDIYKKMGAHLAERKGKKGVCFDVWAPHAREVYVFGEFNDWNETSHEMKRVEPEPWECMSFLYRERKRVRCISLL